MEAHHFKILTKYHIDQEIDRKTGGHKQNKNMSRTPEK